MGNDDKFNEVVELLRKAHDSIFEGSDYKLFFTDNEATQIATTLENDWKFYKEKFLEAGKSISEAVKSYKPEMTLWMLYCRLMSGKVRNLNHEDRNKLIEFMKTKGLEINLDGYHFVGRHSPIFDGIPYHFFYVKIEETEGFKKALKKLNEALV